MSQAANPEAEARYEQQPITINTILRQNLRTTEQMIDTRFGFNTLDLKSPGGPDYNYPTTHEIRGDCDTDNRTMLNRLYELMDADWETVSVSESDPDNEYVKLTGYYQKLVQIRTAAGVTFQENYARQGYWESFSVTVSPVQE